MAISDEDKKKMLRMSLRERTQYMAKQRQKAAAAKRQAAAQQADKDKKAEAARQAAPANEMARPQREDGGMGKPTTPAAKPKPKVEQSTAPKPKPKPQAQLTASKPKPKPEVAKPTKPNPNANPDRVSKTLSNGSPNPRHPMYDGSAGFERYNRDRIAWERKQKEAAKGRVNRRGRRIT